MSSKAGGNKLSIVKTTSHGSIADLYR